MFCFKSFRISVDSSFVGSSDSSYSSSSSFYSRPLNSDLFNILLLTFSVALVCISTYSLPDSLPSSVKVALPVFNIFSAYRLSCLAYLLIMNLANLVANSSVATSLLIYLVISSNMSKYSLFVLCSAECLNYLIASIASSSLINLGSIKYDNSFKYVSAGLFVLVFYKNSFIFSN